MRTHSTIRKHITFTKVKDNVYIAEVNGDYLNEFISDAVDSFTILGASAFSPLMDISIGTELIARVIADAFVNVEEELVRNTEGGVIVTCTINEINYKVAIAANEEKLGGIVYSILT